MFDKEERHSLVFGKGALALLATDAFLWPLLLRLWNNLLKLGRCLTEDFLLELKEREERSNILKITPATETKTRMQSSPEDYY